MNEYGNLWKKSNFKLDVASAIFNGNGVVKQEGNTTFDG